MSGSKTSSNRIKEQTISTDAASFIWIGIGIAMLAFLIGGALANWYVGAAAWVAWLLIAGTAFTVGVGASCLVCFRAGRQA